MKRTFSFARVCVYVLLLNSFGNCVSGQVLMSPGAYSQNFDSLTNNGSAGWTNNVTLPGWYASTNAGGIKFGSEVLYRAGTGSDITGALYSYGDSGSTERALGSLASGTPGNFAYGIRFTNDTESAQTNITISYTGEQWRVANATEQKLSFTYQIGFSLTNSDAASNQLWTAFPALDFISPNTNLTQTLKGNDPTNRVIITSVVLTGAVVQPGQEIFLRWFDRDDTGSDDGLAIDDLIVLFTPTEPSIPVTNGGFSLLTYNVKGNGAADWSTNATQVQAIGRELVYLNPDIITFNEIPLTNTYQMTNWVTAYLPGYFLAMNSGSDGFIRSVIASRFPITRSSKWLDGADLKPFGYTNTSTANADNFTRDLFEAEITVPNFPQPLHVFTTHLKATSTNYFDAAAKRAAECAAITNWFATNYFILYPTHPYTLSGDLNDSDTNTVAIQELLSTPTGLRLTNPINPFTGSINTFSTTTANPSDRIDYIMPCTLLSSTIVSSQVFRTDRLNPLPPDLFSNDCKVASDHLPVLMVFGNPYQNPFHLTSITRNNEALALNWESVPGQSYRVETSSNLLNWTTFATNLLATNYSFMLNTNSSAAPQFFRVRRLN